MAALRWSSLVVFVGWTYATGAMFALDEQNVRVCDWIRRYYWFSMQYEVTIAVSSCDIQKHYDDDSALITVGWINWTGATDKQPVRVCNWICMRYWSVFLAVRYRYYNLRHTLFYFSNTLRCRWRLWIVFKQMHGTSMRCVGPGQIGSTFVWSWCIIIDNRWSMGS